MRNVALDTETALIVPGCNCPPMSCGTFAFYEGAEIQTRIMNVGPAVDYIEALLDDDDVTIIGHNLAFDLAVVCRERSSLIPKTYRKYEQGLARDTLIQQQQLDIANGDMKFFTDEDGEPKRTSYSLAALSYRNLKEFVKKENTPRLHYGPLRDKPVSEWTEEQREYAINDARITLRIHHKQLEIAGVPHEVDDIPTVVEQFKASWALHLMSVRGIRTNGQAVAKLKGELEQDHNEMLGRLRQTPLIKQVTKKGVVDDVRDMKAIRGRVEAAYVDREVPRTDPSDKFPDGQIATDKKTMLESGDEDLKLLSEAGGVEKLLSTYIPVLESGTKVPINAHFNALVESGRTSCSRPNLQNPPRKGGVRECIVPRAGMVFISADASTIEMRTLAQCNLWLQGYSRMAEVLRAGKDLHIVLAAQLLGISVEEAEARAKQGDNEVEDARQLAKIANFGLPGALSAKTFVEYATGFGHKISLEKAQEVHASFFEAWPEMRNYFRHIQQVSDEGTLVQMKSGRLRGGVSYCSAANSYFQGLAADACKASLWDVSKECYTAKESPLYGTRPVIFMHDEIIAETPFDPANPRKSHEAATRLSYVMRTAMEQWIPDIPIICEPVMTRRLYKGAKQALSDGLLVPARPLVVEVDGKKRTKWVPDLEEERIAA